MDRLALACPLTPTCVPYADLWAQYMDDHESILDEFIRCEMHLYGGRLSEARYLLSRLPAESDLYVILRAELAIEEADLDAAEALLEPIQSSRAFLNRARIGYKRANTADALRWALAAGIAARAEGYQLMEARALHIEAWARQQDEPAAAADRYEECLRLYAFVRAPRYEAFARSDYGSLLLQLGQEHEARGLFGQAYEIALSMGIVTDATMYLAAALFVLYGDGDYAGVLCRSGDVADTASSLPGWVALNHVLRIRACSSLALGRPDAVASAEAYLVTSGNGTSWDRIAGPLLHARALCESGADCDAIDALPALVAAAEATGEAEWAAIAKLWYWSALVHVDIVAASLRWRELREPATARNFIFAKMEVRAVDAAPRPYRILAPGRVELDFSDPARFPKRNEAKAIVDAVQFAAAHGHTGGNATKMAEMIDQDRRHVTRLMKLLGLKPKGRGRPSRR